MISTWPEKNPDGALNNRIFWRERIITTPPAKFKIVVFILTPVIFKQEMTSRTFTIVTTTHPDVMLATSVMREIQFLT